MKITEPYLDINGLVLPSPRYDDKPADNGVLYTSISILLDFEVPDYKEKIKDCYLECGLIARWHGNNFDNCAWDDYLGIAAACIKLGITDIPKDILQYGLHHFFVYDTNGKLEFKDFLLRNVPIWPLMIIASAPSTKKLLYPILWAIQKTFTSPSDLLLRNDTSAIQLQWVFLESCFLLGFHFDSYTEHCKYIAQAFKIYYSESHPFNNLY